MLPPPPAVEQASVAQTPLLRLRLLSCETRKHRGPNCGVRATLLNNAYMGKDIYHPTNAYGTDLKAGDAFNGNAYLNILAGADFLKSLKDPGHYVGSDSLRTRMQPRIETPR